MQIVPPRLQSVPDTYTRAGEALPVPAEVARDQPASGVTGFALVRRARGDGHDGVGSGFVVRRPRTISGVRYEVVDWDARLSEERAGLPELLPGLHVSDGVCDEDTATDL